MSLNAIHLSFLCVSGCSAKLVDIALETGKIYDGEGFKYIKESFETGTLHLIGLLSDGGVHSRLDQLQVFQFSKIIFINPEAAMILCSFSYMLYISLMF